jgi:hypothetical protein
MSSDRKISATSFFRGLAGLGRVLLIVGFAAVLSFLADNLVVGIALAAISMYAWMLRGEIDALHNRIRKLEAIEMQPKAQNP